MSVAVKFVIHCPSFLTFEEVDLSLVPDTQSDVKNRCMSFSGEFSETERKGKAEFPL